MFNDIKRLETMAHNQLARQYSGKIDDAYRTVLHGLSRGLSDKDCSAIFREMMHFSFTPKEREKKYERGGYILLDLLYYDLHFELTNDIGAYSEVDLPFEVGHDLGLEGHSKIILASVHTHPDQAYYFKHGIKDEETFQDQFREKDSDGNRAINEVV